MPARALALISRIERFIFNTMYTRKGDAKIKQSYRASVSWKRGEEQKIPEDEDRTIERGTYE
jgi:hypothetical protein